MKKIIKENMSKHLITIKYDYSLDAAYNQMQANNIRHLPVLDESDAVVGILSDRDLSRAMRSKLEGAWGMKVESLDFDPQARVSDYMTWPVKVVDVNASLKTVTAKMIQEKLSCFLIADKEQIVGIVTSEDLLRALYHLLSEDEGKSSKLAFGILMEPGFQKLTQMISDTGL